MTRFFSPKLVFVLLALASTGQLNARPPQTSPTTVDAIQHVIWIWFENKEISDMMSSSAPTFSSFANNNVNFTNFYALTHPSQPNYIRAFSGSTQGVSTNDHFSFPASADNLAKQLAAAGKSWRVYVQNYPGNCFDGDDFFGGIDGPGVSGQYVRKHNPVISFESVRLNPAECANVQPLAGFDPTVNFSFVTPNMTNDMHDGSIEQGDAFFQAFLPLVTSSPDWAHTLLIVSFDEGTTSVNGGGHIYTAAAAPWLSQAVVRTTYNHYDVLRTIEDIFGLPYLGNAATATTITELFPPTPTPTPTPSPTPAGTPTPSPTPEPTVSIAGKITYCSSAGLVPVQGVTMTLTGSLEAATLTDSSGTYLFASVPSGGNYSIEPARPGLPTGSQGIDTIDVLAVQRHYLGISSIPPGCSLTAADVDVDNLIDTFDVVGIQRFFLGRPFGIANVGKYYFNPANRSYLDVTADLTGQDFDAQVFGDVVSPFANRADRPSQQ